MPPDRFDYDVFISYRWTEPDQSWVRESLAPALRSAGLLVCLDVEDFVPGRDLILEMNRAGKHSRKALCIITPKYFEDNRFVFFESLMARRIDPSGHESRLIPLILSHTVLPEWMAGLIPVDWTNHRFHAREWKKLLDVLDAPGDASPPGTLPADTEEQEAPPPVGPAFPMQSEGPGNGHAAAATTITGIGISDVELRIDRDPSEFTPEAQERLLRVIWEVLHIENAKIIRVRPGSTIVTLRLPHTEAERLYWAAKAGALEECGVTDAVFAEEVDLSPGMIRPLKDRVLVQQVPSAPASRHIHSPEFVIPSYHEAIVLAVGRDVRELSVGDRVAIGRYVGMEVMVESEPLLILSERDVICILSS